MNPRKTQMRLGGDYTGRNCRNGSIKRHSWRPGFDLGSRTIDDDDVVNIDRKIVDIFSTL